MDFRFRIQRNLNNREELGVLIQGFQQQEMEYDVKQVEFHVKGWNFAAKKIKNEKFEEGFRFFFFLRSLAPHRTSEAEEEKRKGVLGTAKGSKRRERS